MTWPEKQAELTRIYDRFEEEARVFKKNALCRQGCTFCCTDMGSVDIVTLEGLRIRERLQGLPRADRQAMEKRVAWNRKQKEQAVAVPCPFLDEGKGLCLVYDIRPFSCRQLYSVEPCGAKGPTVHRQAVLLARRAVKAMQRLDDGGYSGHLSFILHLLDNARFRATYLGGGFDPSQIMVFGKSHGIVINRFVK